MNKQGILIVLSGFSGAGKGTLMSELMGRYNNYALSISATTRKPRKGEKDGREYFFKSVEEFEALIDNDRLIEYAKYVNNYYGTPKDYVEEQLAAGKDVILEIEIQGARKIREQFPDALLLFVAPPTADELKRRLTGRGTEDAETIQCRMMRAIEEADGMEYYDYLIINKELDTCVEQIHQIIQSEHGRVKRNLSLIRNIKEELKSFSEGV